MRKMGGGYINWHRAPGWCVHTCEVFLCLHIRVIFFQRWIDVNAGLQPPDVRGKTGSWHVTQTADRLTVRPSR